MLKVKTAAARLWVLLFTCTVAFFYTRAEAHAQSVDAPVEQRSTVRVHFASDKFDVNAGYNNNASALKSIDELLASSTGDETAQVEIVSYSSPEGNSLYNQYLSEQRCAALRRYIVKLYLLHVVVAHVVYDAEDHL